VAWGRVCRPIELGGLGIFSLKQLGWALKMRWLWLAKTEPSKPWAFLHIHLSEKVRSFFSAVTYTEIGDGASTLFWQDHWIFGKRIEYFAPRLLVAVPKQYRKCRTVQDALADNKWIADIKGALTVRVLADFLDLSENLLSVNIYPGCNDKHIFSIASDGKYSAKADYNGLFIGSTHFDHWERIWHSWAPPECNFFLLLAALKRCWTADRLQKRGLNHPERCPLCDQEPETIDHLLVGCVFARNFWFMLLGQVNLQSFTPQVGEENVMQWWKSCSDQLQQIARKDLNSLIILGLWTIWNHRN
jgi:hypothetical protein